MTVDNLRIKVTMKDMDQSFLEEVIKHCGEDHILNCYQCGICSSGCTISKDIVSPPHRLIAMTLMGLREKVLSDPSIWICSYCHACTERCPKNVNFSHVLAILRNLSAEHGYTSLEELPWKTYRAAIDMNYDFGAGIALIGSQLAKTNRVRNKMGLPEIPKMYLEEIRKVMDVIKSKERVRKPIEVKK
ncbi:MAG: 4Fe-4S dicluster domain-containing protein [Candidatus Helarchaeales archaeon]